MAATTTETHANWDLTPFFDSIDDAAYLSFRDTVKADVASLLTDARAMAALNTASMPAWTDLLVRFEELVVRGSHVAIFVNCLASEDTRNAPVLGERASLADLWASFGKVETQIEAGFRKADEKTFEALVAAPALKGCRYAMERIRTAAQNKMAPELEELVADLSINGFGAWGRLYNQLNGRLEFDQAQPDGTSKRVPMALRRSLMEDASAQTRAAAFNGGNKAWQDVDYVAGAALNAIAGHRLKLYERRGGMHFLDQALFDSGITRKTLDAMMGAIAKSYELPRAFLRRKAELLGKDKLDFADVSAPLPIEGLDPVTWGDATRRITKAFGNAYPALGDFAQMAFDKNWVESEPRAGKSPGGYCTTSSHLKQSRIFMTYNDTLGDVQTLAHELGHAFHSWVMRDLRRNAQGYPMTLAETASTFAETLFTDDVLQNPNASDVDRALVLNTRLDNAHAFLLNIPMRYQFEKQFYEERAAGEVSVDRLKEIMLDAQRATYGDVLSEENMDPYFWASKLHFYITGVSFYNFPYSFGYLFSLGVYNRRQALGDSFESQYEKLLRMTGSASAEEVAKQSIGVDIENEAFWLESINSVRPDLDAFNAVTAKLFKA